MLKPPRKGWFLFIKVIATKNGCRYTENSNYTQFFFTMTVNQQESLMKALTRATQPDTTSLDTDLQKQHPENLPPAYGTQRAEWFQQQAEVILEKKPYLRFFLLQANAFQFGPLQVKGSQTHPEEINRMILLMDQYGLTQDQIQNNSIKTQLQQAVGGVFLTCLAQMNGSQYDIQHASWAPPSVIRSPRHNSSQALLDTVSPLMTAVHGADRVHQVVKKTDNNQLMLDLAVMSALACDDPLAALSLAQAAQTFVPDDQSAIFNSLNRFQTTGFFDRARQLSGHQQRFDGVLASIGEPKGPLAQIDDKGVANQIKEGAVERIKAEFERQKARSISLQEVAPASQISSLLEPDALEQKLREKLADLETDGIKTIESTKQRVEQLVIAHQANLIARILMQRLFPEVNPDAFVDNMATHASGKLSVDQSVKPPQLNIFEAIYKFVEPTTRPGFVADRITLHRQSLRPKEAYEALFVNNPLNNLEVSQILAFLQKPAVYLNQVRTTISEYAKTQRQLLKTDSEINERVRLAQALLCQKFLGSLDLIEAIIKQSELSLVLDQAFGLPSRSINPGRIDELRTYLKTEFDKPMVALSDEQQAQATVWQEAQQVVDELFDSTTTEQELASIANITHPSSRIVDNMKILALNNLEEATRKIHQELKAKKAELDQELIAFKINLNKNQAIAAQQTATLEQELEQVLAIIAQQKVVIHNNGMFAKMRRKLTGGPTKEEAQATLSEANLKKQTLSDQIEAIELGLEQSQAQTNSSIKQTHGKIETITKQINWLDEMKTRLVDEDAR